MQDGYTKMKEYQFSGQGEKYHIQELTQLALKDELMIDFGVVK